ncbi:MAG: cupin domain-containing protein [Candidatus Rokubacteria bacterium]|nr:cupin domain-containing protein [Candidatus Rokubacteria bacterium]
MPADAGNLFADLPRSRPDERIEVLLSSPTLRVERIVSTGQATPPGEWYDQDTDEWVALLAGSARLRFEDEAAPRELRPGDWIFIGAHRRHRVEATDAHAPTVWLALHLGG